jgi:type I restriction enzyme, S subunit
VKHSHYPTHWATASLDEITEFVTSGSRGWGEHYSESGPLFIRVGNLDHDTVHIDLQDTVHVRPPSGAEGLRTRVKEGDILISITAEVGMIGLVRADLGEAYVNQHVALVRPLSDVYPAGLAYSLLDPQGLQAVARREQYGATKPGLSLIQVRAFEVPIPPSQEHKRIVEALESYFSRLDDAVATLERVERNLKRYRASVLKAAIEGRLVPTEAELARQEGRDYESASVLLKRILSERRHRWVQSGKKGKYKQFIPPGNPNLPDLPEGWRWATLGQVAPLQAGFAFPSSGFCRSGVPLLKGNNVRDGWLSNSEIDYWPKDDSVEYEQFRLNEGDVVLAMDRPVYSSGSKATKVAMLGREWNGALLLQRVGCFRRSSSLEARYLYLFVLSDEFRQHILGGQNGSQDGKDLPHVSASAVDSCPFPLPPVAEQRRIVQAADRFLTIAAVAMQSLETSHHRCARLRQSILKMAFEGKLVDQNPNDATASDLLERIKLEQRERASRSRLARNAAPKVSLSEHE